MALKKDIELSNGIILTYHRIVSVNNITNQTSIIEVASYINEAQRNKEKEFFENNKQGDINVFINTNYYSREYDKNLNVDNGYKYLKTLNDFIESENV